MYIVKVSMYNEVIYGLIILQLMCNLCKNIASWGCDSKYGELLVNANKYSCYSRMARICVNFSNAEATKDLIQATIFVLITMVWVLANWNKLHFRKTSLCQSTLEMPVAPIADISLFLKVQEECKLKAASSPGKEKLFASSQVFCGAIIAHYSASIHADKAPEVLHMTTWSWLNSWFSRQN